MALVRKLVNWLAFTVVVVLMVLLAVGLFRTAFSPKLPVSDGEVVSARFVDNGVQASRSGTPFAKRVDEKPAHWQLTVNADGRFWKVQVPANDAFECRAGDIYRRAPQRCEPAT